MKRKLVDIGESNHKEIEGLQKLCQRLHGYTPTTPSLVQECVALGLVYLKNKIELKGARVK